MGAGDVLRDIYRRMEDGFYSFLDWLDAHGVPVYNVVDWLEGRGIPAFPAFLAVLLLLLTGVALLLGPSAVPTRSIMITVQDEYGNPVPGAQVVLHAPGGVTFTATTDETGTAYFDDIPEGTYSYEVLVDGRKLGEKVDVETDVDTITLSPPEDESIRFCVQVLDDETGETLFGATVTSGTISFEYIGGVYCARVRDGALVSVGADGYEGQQITAQSGYDESHPYTVRLRKVSSVSSTGYKLTVTVVYEGSPVAAKVRIIRGGSVLYEQTVPETTGTTSFGGLSPGEYTIVAFGEGKYSTLRIEKMVNLDRDLSITLDLKDGETIEPPAETPMKGEEGYEYAYTINGASKPKLRVGKNTLKVCVKTSDDSVDAVEVSVGMDGKVIGGPAYIAPRSGEVSCEEVTVNAEREGTATLSVRFTAGGSVVKEYSESIPVEMTKFTAVLCAKGDDGKRIPGAYIKVGAEEKTTDNTGCASFVLPPGEYDVHIEADGYLPLDDKINVSSNTTKTFTLSLDLASAGYHCEGDTCFRVLYNGLPSSQLAEGVTAGGPVTIKACARSAETTRVFIKNEAGGQEKTLTTFTIPASPTTRCVSRSVRPSEGTLVVEFVQKGETVYADQVSVKVEMYTLTMCVYSSRDRNGIVGAQVMVGDESGTTGEDGCVDIDVPAGRWKYRVTADGYSPASGTVSVYSSFIKRVYLNPGEEGEGSLQVCVKDEFSRKPVEGATIHVGDQEWTTGEDGCVEDSIEPGTYEVWAEKDGYVETEEKSVVIRAGGRRRITLTMRPDVEGALALVGITSGGQPVAILAGGTYTLEFSVTTPSRARRATIHVVVDEYQDILTVGGGKHARIPAPMPGRTKTVRVTLRVKPVQDKVTLPIYYYMSVETENGEYNIPSGGGKLDVDIYPLRQAVPCSKSGVGITVFPRVKDIMSSYLQAGVENELVILVGTCRLDVSVSDIVLTVQTPDGKKESTTFSGAGEPYRPEEHVYRITPEVKDVGMYVSTKVEAKQDTSILAVSEKKFQISYYQRDVCLRVQVTPATPMAGSSFTLRISPHLCQSANKLPDDWSAHRNDIKIQIVGGSAISSSMYGKQIPFVTTIAPTSHGDIVLACTSTYYTCRFDPPDTGTDKYTIWVYRGGLVRFSSDLYILPIISGEVYNEIPLKVVNYTKYDVHDVSATYECKNYTPGLWQFEISPPSSIPASSEGKPGEAEVLFSATWAGDGEPKERPECTVTLKGIYNLEEKNYAVMTTTTVRVNAGISIEGIKVSPLGEDGKMHVQTGIWKHFEVNITLPENVPFSNPNLQILLEADNVSYDLSEPHVIGNVVKYDLWLKDDGTANREYPLTFIFSAHVGVKDVKEEMTYTVHAEYLPEILQIEPAETSFTIWPEGVPEPDKVKIVLTNASAEQVTVSLSYEPERDFYTLNVESDRGAYFTLNAGDQAELNVSIEPVKEKLGASSISDSTQITVEYSIATPSGVERKTLEIPIAVQYIPKGCLELELLRDEVHKGEKTVLVVKNGCGTDVKDITVYETVDGSTCTYDETLSIPADVEEAYVQVPFFTDSCKEPDHDTTISFQVSAPHVGQSSRVALRYIAEETPYKQGEFYTCQGEHSPRNVAYAYDQPFTSKDSCDVAYCGYGEFYSALQERLVNAFKGAAEDALKFSTPSQIPGCDPSKGWCALPVRSFSLYAKDGVQIIQLAELLNEKFAEEAGAYYQYAGTYANTLSPSSVYTTPDSSQIDGCGRYTFVVQPYVQVTPGAVVYDHLAFVLTIKRIETDECRDTSVLNAHLHFNFGSGGGVEKGAVAAVVFDTSSFFEAVGTEQDLANNVDKYLKELEEQNAVKVYRDVKELSTLGNEHVIILKAGDCGGDNQPPLAKIHWDPDKNILTFTFCTGSIDQIDKNTVKDIISGWLAGPNTNVRFSGCLQDDQTFLVYGVIRKQAQISGTHGTVKLMPGIPGKVTLDFHQLGICPEGMRCYYRINKVIIAYETAGKSEPGKDVPLGDVGRYNFSTPTTTTETAEGSGTEIVVLTDGSVFEVTLDPDKEWGDRATIVLILTPANEYGEGVRERRVVIPVEIVGLSWDDLARILLTPECNYETWEACIFQKVVKEIASETGMNAGEVAKMITGETYISGVSLENIESWDEAAKKIVSDAGIEFNVWVRDPEVTGENLCNYILTNHIIPPEDSYTKYIVNVFVDNHLCVPHYGQAKFLHFANVANMWAPSGAAALAAHAGVCATTTAACEWFAAAGTLGTSAAARLKDIAIELIGCGVGGILSNMGLQYAAAGAISSQAGNPWIYAALAAATAAPAMGAGIPVAAVKAGMITTMEGALIPGSIGGLGIATGIGVSASSPFLWPTETKAGFVGATGAYSPEGFAMTTGGRIAAQAIVRYLATERFYRRINTYYKQLVKWDKYIGELKGAPAIDDLRQIAVLSEDLSSTWGELRAAAGKLGLKMGELGGAPPKFVDELADALKTKGIFKNADNARDFVIAVLKGGEDDLLALRAIAKDSTARTKIGLSEDLAELIKNASSHEEIRQILKNNNINPEELITRMKRNIVQSNDFKEAVKSAWTKTSEQALEGLKRFKQSWLSRLAIQLGCGLLGQLSGTFANLAVLSAEGAFSAPSISIHMPLSGGLVTMSISSKGVRT